MHMKTTKKRCLSFSIYLLPIDYVFGHFGFFFILVTVTPSSSESF